VALTPGVSVDVDDVAVLREAVGATTQAAPGKTVPHCLKERLVVTMVARFSRRRSTIAYTRLAALASHGR
jgi:hypothetical protein